MSLSNYTNSLQCPYSSCPGCRFKELSYEDAIVQKMQRLRKTLDIWSETIEEIFVPGKDFQKGYRAKVCLSADFIDNSWKIGLRKRDDIIPIPDCPAHAETVNQVLKIVLNVLPDKEKFPLVYFVQSRNQLVFILKSNVLPNIEWLTESVKRQLSLLQIEGIWLHLHPSAGRKVFGKGGFHLIHGTSRSKDENGIIYGPMSFNQQIPSLFNYAVETSLNYFNPNEDDSIVDLYCGTGTSMKQWVTKVNSVIGVELNGEAVECAALNVPGQIVLRGSCNQRIPQVDIWLRRNSKNRAFLFVNPPRTGLDEKLIQWIITKQHFERVAYLSCSPGTLKRDIEALDLQYNVEKIQPCDFFPFTHHTECLVLLKRK